MKLCRPPRRPGSGRPGSSAPGSAPLVACVDPARLLTRTAADQGGAIMDRSLRTIRIAACPRRVWSPPPLLRRTGTSMPSSATMPNAGSSPAEAWITITHARGEHTVRAAHRRSTSRRARTTQRSGKCSRGHGGLSSSSSATRAARRRPLWDPRELSVIEMKSLDLGHPLVDRIRARPGAHLPGWEPARSWFGSTGVLSARPCAIS